MTTPGAQLSAVSIQLPLLSVESCRPFTGNISSQPLLGDRNLFSPESFQLIADG